jgi:tetratricopeptide (TPR) repeat protein
MIRLYLHDLGNLVIRGEYQRCVEEGIALLRGGELSPYAEPQILSTICRCHLQLGHPTDAIGYGLRAIKTAVQQDQWDVEGSTLHDMAHAYAKLGNRDGVIRMCRWFMAELDRFTAARCLEGRMLCLWADTLVREGRVSEAEERYARASRWFDRYGDISGRLRTQSARVRLRLAAGALDEAAVLIKEAEARIQAEKVEKRVISAHLLDRALYFLTAKDLETAVKAAWLALELAEESWGEVAEAYLVLGEAALAMAKPVDALNFVVGARSAAQEIGDRHLLKLTDELRTRLIARYGGEPESRLNEEYQRALNWPRPVEGDD